MENVIEGDSDGSEDRRISKPHFRTEKNIVGQCFVKKTTLHGKKGK